MTTTTPASASVPALRRLPSWLGIAGAYLLAIGAWVALAVELARSLP